MLQAGISGAVLHTLVDAALAQQQQQQQQQPQLQQHQVRQQQQQEQQQTHPEQHLQHLQQHSRPGAALKQRTSPSLRIKSSLLTTPVAKAAAEAPHRQSCSYVPPPAVHAPVQPVISSAPAESDADAHLFPAAVHAAVQPVTSPAAAELGAGVQQLPSFSTLRAGEHTSDLPSPSGRHMGGEHVAGCLTGSEAQAAPDNDAAVPTIMPSLADKPPTAATPVSNSVPLQAIHGPANSDATGIEVIEAKASAVIDAAEGLSGRHNQRQESNASEALTESGDPMDLGNVPLGDFSALLAASSGDER